MTVAVAVKVDDGIVVGADSAATLTLTLNNGQQIHQVYENANKIINLVKGLPIALVTWGLGGIGRKSMTTVLKDLRASMTAGKNGAGS